MLGVFDQSLKESNHILNINEEDYPEEFQGIVRKLQKAMVDEEVQTTMDIEDEILAELEEKEREIENMAETIEKNNILLSEKDDLLSEKDDLLSEKDKEIEVLKRLLNKK